jgi:apolipoprotein D and lipocalin family protein
MKRTAALLLLVLAFSCAETKERPMNPPDVVPFVDVNRYAGLWYEIARYPNTFQEGCVGSRATYTVREDGKITVLNECYDRTFQGELRSVRGTARVSDRETNAKLKVSFFWPFSGDYWIIDLGDSYEYAVVGHPKRKYVWILGRTKKMDPETYRKILARLREQGYDTSRLILTPQE